MNRLAELRAEEWNKPRWDERIALIADLVPPGASVIDLGAGGGFLERHLPPGCAYSPADIHPTTPGTLPLSWDENVYPAGRWSVAVLSGSIEYAADPRSVLWHVRQLAPVALISYEHGETLVRRRSNGFRNHLSKAGLESEFERAGWSHREMARWRTQIIYRLEELK